MALQVFPNSIGGNLTSFLPYPLGDVGGESAMVMDAAGESNFMIGRLVWASGIGTSKVVSSAGAKIYFTLNAAATFANAGTTLTVGIQDVSSGLEDGTFDVSLDLVGGTDSPGANDVFTAHAMDTGSKTIAWGDTVAIGCEMVSRGGSDTVSMQRRIGPYVPLLPYISADTGSGPARANQNSHLNILVESDDGTLGWIVGGAPFVRGLENVNNTDTPDEFSNVFQVPFKTQACGIIMGGFDNIGTADTLEFVLYSDPLGTPVAERTVTIDPNNVFSATAEGHLVGLFSSAFELAIDTDYAVAFRPTSANDISIFALLFPTAQGQLRGWTALGTNWQSATRTNQAGAFTEDANKLYNIGPILNAFRDDHGLRAHTHLGIG